MGTKNGICPYCQFARFENRIFPVNPEASTVFCPYCMRELQPKKAIELYNGIIEKMLEKADNSLFVACDPVIAYKQYADVLEVEKNNSKALLGRILCLIYTSKVRDSYLKEADILLENISHKGVEEVNNYVISLKKINFALDEYDEALNKKLSNHHNYFYDEDCLKLYLRHLYDIVKFKKEILSTLNVLRQDYVTQRNDVFINLLNHDISTKESSLKGVKFTVEGKGYKLTKVMNDKAYVELSGDFVEVRKNKKNYSLYPSDKSQKKISNLAFKDYTSTIRAKKASIYLIVFFLIVSAGALATAFIIKEPPILFYGLLAGGALAFIGAVTFFILYLVWRSILKKRKMRIA